MKALTGEIISLRFWENKCRNGKSEVCREAFSFIYRSQNLRGVVYFGVQLNFLTHFGSYCSLINLSTLFVLCRGCNCFTGYANFLVYIFFRYISYSFQGIDLIIYGKFYFIFCQRLAPYLTSIMINWVPIRV